MKPVYFLFLILVVCGIFFLNLPPYTPPGMVAEWMRPAYAVSPEEQTVGLSGRTTFKEGEVLILPFDREENHCMWSADMLVPVKVEFYDREGVMQTSEILPAGEMNPHCAVSKYVIEIPQKG